MIQPTDSISHCSVASNLGQKECSDLKGTEEEKNITRHKSFIVNKSEQTVSLKKIFNNISLSGCFFTNNNEFHCSNCHKNLTAVNANKCIREKVFNLNEFHYKDCYGLVTTELLANASKGISVANQAKQEQKICLDTVDGRESTFPADWIHAAYLPVRHMARAGFMYNNVQRDSNDSVKCCYCTVRIHNWTRKGNPFVRHVELNPFCPYKETIEFKKGLEKFVEEKQKNTEKVGQPVAQNVGEKQGNKPQQKQTSSHRSDSKNATENPLTMTALSNQKKASAPCSELETFSKLGYGDFNSRIQSYSSPLWINGLSPSSTHMAGAGFFFTESCDTVECFSCHYLIGSWRRESDPYLSHCGKRPSCAYVQSEIFKRKRKEFISEVQASQASRDMKKNTIESNPSPTRSLVNVNYTLNEREKSFSSSWDGRSLLSAKIMAEAGFYAIGLSDAVKCAHCSFFVNGWNAAQNPFEAHIKGCDTSTHCPLMEGEVFKQGRKKFEEQRAAQAIGWEKQNGSLIYVKCQSKKSESSDDTTPAAPDYSIFGARLNSFNSPLCSMIIKDKAREMAETGLFYTSGSDNVMCIFCHQGLKTWKREDVPAIEHAKYSPNCPSLTKNSGGEKQNKATKSPSDIKSNIDHRLKNPAVALKSSADAKPALPNYSILESRLSSFNSSPCATIIKNKAHDMAETGLFYEGKLGEVTCAFCDIRINQWELADVPKIEHAKHNPSCPFLKKDEKNRVAIETQKKRQPSAVATKTANKTTLKQAQGSSEKSADPLAIDDRSILENETTKVLREMGYLDKDILTATKKVLSRTKERLDVVSILDCLN